MGKRYKRKYSPAPEGEYQRTPKGNLVRVKPKIYRRGRAKQRTGFGYKEDGERAA